ncbi:MAG: molybdopterin-binding protein [Tateyamaria sp.]|uniref:molybdopterin-binding protein n=1 Tax=Tateyamaria sp. TaxID=1929288 RepID=UPI0032DD79A2
MIFGPVPVAEAEGAVLAHSMTSQSTRIAKGTLLTKTHVTALLQAGHTEVTVAQLEVGDVEENQAAETLARAIVQDAASQNVRISAAGAGRVNFYATCPGVAEISAEKVAAINAVDPMITVATVPNFHRADAGTMLATIKIISYAVPARALEAACAASRYALGVLGSEFSQATLIETHVGKDTPSSKGREAMIARTERLGLTMTERVIVRHNTTAIAAAIADAPGDILFILTASATSDPRDVAPEALRIAGGRVEAYGMPVDPGNLLFFGEVAGKPVIGLPGCARSPALNGADWVLERLVCGVPLKQADISAMGVGGLLKEIPTRPRPRASGAGQGGA